MLYTGDVNVSSSDPELAGDTVRLEGAVVVIFVDCVDA
jgi:hypothetical protein